jgi:hypothetical protein
MWKQDEIATFRNKLRENRDNVHVHLAGRISRQVKSILSVEIIHLQCLAGTDSLAETDNSRSAEAFNISMRNALLL